MPVSEIVVVDDGSNNPETIAFLNTLTGVKLVRQENKGLPAARNAGIRAANGTHVLPLDADDWLAPNAIERLSGTLRDHPNLAYAAAHIMLEGEYEGELAKNYNYFEQLFLNQVPYCILLPKRLWEAAGGYNEEMRHGYEDWEFNIRLGAMGHHCAVVHEPLFHYWVSGSGMLRSVSTGKHGELWRDIQEQHPDLYTWSALFGTWKVWRWCPSTYPPFLYFGWALMHRTLPAKYFQQVFRALMPNSQAKRVTHAHNQKSSLTKSARIVR